MEQNIGSGQGAAGSVSETYSSGVVAITAPLQVPAVLAQYGVTGTIQGNFNINLITLLNTLAQKSGNATVEEVEGFVAKLLPLS